MPTIASPNQNTSPSPLLNKFQVAERLGMHFLTVLKHTRLGHLECYKFGPHSYRYSEEQVARFMAGNLAGGKR
jgi:excisionase family DNA binding protein